MDPTEPTDLEEVPAAYYLYAAGAHFDGAARLLRLPDFGADDRDYFPVYLLLCNSMELALKSFLMLKGFSDGQLIAIGHKLTEALDKAVAEGLSEGDARYLAEKLQPVHARHMLRYTKGEKVKVGDPERALRIINDLIEQVGSALGPLVALPRKDAS